MVPGGLLVLLPAWCVPGVQPAYLHFDASVSS
jgi:hypothetical protein